MLQLDWRDDERTGPPTKIGFAVMLVTFLVLVAAFARMIKVPSSATNGPAAVRTEAPPH
jgi:hypothetical protein